MKMLEVGKITLKEAGEKIGVCYRQAKRIRRVLKEKGMKGLIHGNTGRPSHHRLSEMLRQKVLQLSRKVYHEFNDTHFAEKLGEEEGVVLSRETVRKIRREAGIEPKRKRRSKRHRKRRERMAQEGWMVLWDGSVHLWFGEKYPPCCLMATITFLISSISHHPKPFGFLLISSRSLQLPSPLFPVQMDSPSPSKASPRLK